MAQSSKDYSTNQMNTNNPSTTFVKQANGPYCRRRPTATRSTPKRTTQELNSLADRRIASPGNSSSGIISQDIIHRPILSQEAVLPILAFLAGISDFLCYRRIDFYVAMMTGNVIRACTSLAEKKWKDAADFAAVVAGYGLGSGLWRVLSIALSSSAAVIAAAVVALPLYYRSDIKLSSPLLAFAFGLICSSATSVGGTITFAYTGHVNNAGKYIADAMLQRIQGGKGRGITFKHTPITSIRLLAGFAAGIIMSVLVQQSAWVSRTVDHEGISSWIIQHPFTSLGVAYAIVLCLGGVNCINGTANDATDAKDTKEGGTLAESIMSTKLKKYGRRRRGEELDVREDGWTNMQSGPRGYADGS